MAEFLRYTVRCYPVKPRRLCMLLPGSRGLAGIAAFIETEHVLYPLCTKGLALTSTTFCLTA